MENQTKNVQQTVLEPSTSDIDSMIRNHVYSSITVGLIPLPLVDFVGVAAVQMNLVRKLGKAYGIPFSQDSVKNVLSSLIGGTIPATAGLPLSSAVKTVPLVGQSLGALSMPIVAGASTYAIGKVFYRHFASGGTFLTFNPEKAKDYYNKMFNEGQKVATDIKNDKKK